MFRNRNLWSAALLAAGLGVGYFAASWGDPQAVGQDPAKGGLPGRYTVVDTEAFNLIVVDNQTNTLHYYTVDKDQPPGSDLHLRGSLDLNKVGDATLKPRLVSGAGREPAKAPGGR
jgi:hypothetical protein